MKMRLGDNFSARDGLERQMEQEGAEAQRKQPVGDQQSNTIVYRQILASFCSAPLHTLVQFFLPRQLLRASVEKSDTVGGLW